MNSLTSGLEEVVDGPEDSAFLAWADDRIVGSIVVSDRRNMGYIWGMYIAAPLQRCGIGKTLVRQSVRTMRKSRHVRAYVLKKRESARKFYASLGFSIAEETTIDLTRNYRTEAYVMETEISRLLATLERHSTSAETEPQRKLNHEI